MRLIKLLDYPNVQHYYIENPSARFKKKYPKKFIYAFRDDTRVMIGNDDKVPPMLAMQKCPGYIFSYSKVSLATVFPKMPYPNMLETTNYPVIENLDRVFRKGKDLAISIMHNKNSPVGIPIESIDSSFSIKEFLSVSDENIKQTLKNMYVSFATGTIRNAEEWTEYIIEFVPLTRLNFAPSYPTIIEDDMFKEDALRKDFKLENMFLIYDVHAHSNEEEFDVAHKIDRIMINPNFRITVHDDYTDLANRFKKLIKKPIKTTKDSVTFTFKQYCDIKDGKFTILDCI